MTFVYPWVLVSLLLVLFFYGAKKSSLIEQTFSKEVLDKLQFGTVSGKSFKLYLLIVSFILVVIALARPVVISNEKKEVNQQSFNYVIALDISKSMEAKDIFPTRLAFAKKTIYEVMKKTPEANIAVIAYTNDAFLVSPFSNDFKSIKFLMQNLDSDSLSSKGSQILSALKAAKKVFDSTDDTRKSVLLVSDGADGRGLEKIKEYISKNDLTLYALNIGTKKGATLSDDMGALMKDKNGNIVVSKRDDSLSKIVNGAYLSSSGELSKIDWLVAQIKNSANKKEVKRDRFEGAKELFYYPLALSLLLIFFAFNSLRVPFLVVLLFVQVDSRASMFDFVDIYKAKKSYEKQEYKKAEKGFAKIDTQRAKYNEANALYKQKKYKEALKKYDEINDFNSEMEHKRLHNIGNSYANLGKTDEAIKSYEKALKLKDDEDTKANLKLLKEKKKKEQKKKQKKKKGDQKPKDDKKKKKEKKSDGKKENKQKKKQGKKQEKKAQQSPKKEQKKMSEAEAKKWEKHMNKQKFKTKPMTIKKGEPNEIYW